MILLRVTTSSENSQASLATREQVGFNLLHLESLAAVLTFIYSLNAPRLKVNFYFLALQQRLIQVRRWVNGMHLHTRLRPWFFLTTHLNVLQGHWLVIDRSVGKIKTGRSTEIWRSCVQLLPMNLEIFCDLTMWLSPEFADSYACATFKQSQSIMAIHFHHRSFIRSMFYCQMFRCDMRDLNLSYFSSLTWTSLILL